jgi:hypothetical protein
MGAERKVGSGARRERRERRDSAGFNHRAKITPGMQRASHDEGGESTRVEGIQSGGWIEVVVGVVGSSKRFKRRGSKS